MSRFVVGNVFLLLSMTCAAGSQLLLKAVLDEVGEEGLGRRSLTLLLEGTRPLRGAAGAAMLVAGFLFWIAALTKLDLSYAYPIACSSVLLVTLFSAIFLGEPVTARTWAGTVLILAGVVLLAPHR